MSDDATPQMTEADWGKLWDAFAESPTWADLDPISQEIFKESWHTRAVPIFAQIIEAVAQFDQAQKVRRN